MLDVPPVLLVVVDPPAWPSPLAAVVVVEGRVVVGDCPTGVVEDGAVAVGEGSEVDVASCGLVVVVLAGRVVGGAVTGVVADGPVLATLTCFVGSDGKFCTST
ncbi:MAG: hypothetical protein ACRD0H_17375 [Actinomycetes bacterium]